MRFFSIRRWRVRELLLSWVLYWALLFVVGFGRPALEVWRATRASGQHNTVNVSAGTGGLVLTVIRAGVTTWNGSIHMLPLALLIAAPPLALWFLWAATRRRAEGVREVV